MVSTTNNPDIPLPITDGQHVVFIAADDGPVFIGFSRAPQSTLTGLQVNNHHALELMAARAGSDRDAHAIRELLRPHHIRCGWFAPSPEVMEFAHGRGLDQSNVAHPGGRRLTQEDAVAVFRLAHTTSLPYRVIGDRFGVSAVSVGQIARGAVYRKLFKREPVAPGTLLPGRSGGTVAAVEGDYYVSEAREGAPRYRMTEGRRGPK